MGNSQAPPSPPSGTPDGKSGVIAVVSVNTDAPPEAGEIEAIRALPKFLPLDRTSLKKAPVSFSTLRRPDNGRERPDAALLSEPLDSIVAQHRRFRHHWNQPILKHQAIVTEKMQSTDEVVSGALQSLKRQHQQWRIPTKQLEGEVETLINACDNISGGVVQIRDTLNTLFLLLPETDRADLGSFGGCCGRAEDASCQSVGHVEAAASARAEDIDNAATCKAQAEPSTQKGNSTSQVPKDEMKKEAASWDLGAAKMARKIAEMPEVDPDLDLAALRAKAQSKQMTEEEKKARGLLYDTSKARAVKEESTDEEDAGADLDGGFDWD